MKGEKKNEGGVIAHYERCIHEGGITAHQERCIHDGGEKIEGVAARARDCFEAYLHLIPYRSLFR